MDQKIQITPLRALPQHDPHEWDADEALANLVSERTKLEDIDERGTAERVFRQALPIAAQSIVHLAAFSSNERMRFQAAQYVVERNLGRLQDAPPLNGAEDPFSKLMREIEANTKAQTQSDGFGGTP